MSHRFKIASSGLIWTQLLIFATAAIVTFHAANAPARAEVAQDKQEIVILSFGDSLMAGYQIPIDKAFPAQLEAALRGKGYNVRVLNSGVSGDTAADGLARLDWSLNEKVDGAIVEFGANDALRGIDPKVTEPSLDEILKSLKEKHIELLVAGMEAPRNWGKDYDDAFRAMYPHLAAKYGALLYPFFLKDVATVRSLNLADGLHPSPEGVAVVVRNILPDVEKLIARIREKRAMTRAELP
jgi:acyl-CoA thioesterase-1